MRMCNTCGCPREKEVGRCPECNCTEFSIAPTITYQGWLVRHKKIKTSRILIVGPEDFWNETFVPKKLDRVTRKLQDMEIWMGGFKGFYKIIESWLGKTRKCLSYHPYYPRNYHTNNQKTGRDYWLERNEELLEKKIRFLIAFNNGSDPGILNLIVNARKKRMKVTIVNVED